MIYAYFSQIKLTITKFIEKSNSEISIAVAWFTHRDLFDALLLALDRGVKVSVIIVEDIINCGPNGLDFSTFIAKGGSLRFMNTRKILMHNKFCIFDNKVLVTGSYNWTYSAEARNAENIIVTNDENVCSAFLEQFVKIREELPVVTNFCHMKFEDVSSENFFSCFDFLHEEYESMDHTQIKKPLSVTDVENIRNNFSITKLNTVVANTKRAKPVLRANIGMRCIINGKEDQTLVIVKKGQVLPFTNSVGTQTSKDNLSSQICNVIYGDSNDANNNETLLNIVLGDLPLKKAGEVKFQTRVTIDSTGYMSIEFVCTNTGKSQSAVYDASSKIDYQ